MTVTANQLIAKALSTSSEDEAIACLRMARKRGAKMGASSSKPKEDLSDAEKWKKIAMDYKHLYNLVSKDRAESTEYWKNRGDKYAKENLDLQLQKDSRTLFAILFAICNFFSLITILHLNGFF